MTVSIWTICAALATLFTFALAISIATDVMDDRRQSLRAARVAAEDHAGQAMWRLAGGKGYHPSLKGDDLVRAIVVEFDHRTKGPWLDRPDNWLEDDTAFLERELEFAMGLKERPVPPPGKLFAPTVVTHCPNCGIRFYDPMGLEPGYLLKCMTCKGQWEAVERPKKPSAREALEKIKAEAPKCDRIWTGDGYEKAIVLGCPGCEICKEEEA